MPMLLFAYGTLAPRDPEAAALGGWAADGVRGRLFDLGPYPGLVDCGDPAAGWVEGYVRPVGQDELTGRLDPYEGVDEGLYRRVAATTRAGRRAWVYEYARPLPPNARGPMTRWDGPRDVLDRGPGRATIRPSPGDDRWLSLPIR
jgi:gamma-glutamylcyclotransferase (GGCT)/AIG2-like uncharacterized protein YtfP